MSEEKNVIMPDVINSNTYAKCVDTLGDLPSNAKLEDSNEFYRLYKDENELYIYRIKNPHYEVQ